MLLLILGIVLFIGLVILHELGHFWVAKRNGVEPEEFGIFFPPTLYRKKMKGGWDFTMNLLPLGGFVKLKGEYDADRRPGSFGAASLWAKAKIMLAGVVVNFVTALVLFTILALVGMPQLIPNQFTVTSDTRYPAKATYTVVAGAPEKDSPADKLGIRENDTIVSISKKGEQAQQMAKVEDVTALTKKLAGQEVTVVYARDGKQKTGTTTIRSDSEIAAAEKAGKQIGRLGLPLGQAQEGMTIVRNTWSAPVVAVGVTAQFTKLTFQGLGQAVKGLGGIIAGALTGNKEARQHAQTEASSQVSGPLGIFMILKGGSEYGLVFILTIIALISLTLAIMNVLPIPALDGGRLFVILLARLLNKPLTQKIEEAVYGAGFALLILLIIVITIVDVRRFF